MSKKGISYKASLPAEQVVSHLKGLESSLGQGKICLRVGDEHLLLELDLNQALELELSASQKKNKNKLSLELSWLAAPPSYEDQPEMVISAKAPELQNRAEPEPESDSAE